MQCNPQLWFGKRELEYVPKHFVKTSTPISDESRNWVIEKLCGRFAVSGYTTTMDGMQFQNGMLSSPILIDSLEEYFFFEDSKEAMLYELRWAGKK